MDAEERVWERKEETLTRYRSFEKGLAVDTGYDAKKLAKVCEEEGTTLDKFTKYAQKELELLTSNSTIHQNMGICKIRRFQT